MADAVERPVTISQAELDVLNAVTLRQASLNLSAIPESPNSSRQSVNLSVIPESPNSSQQSVIPESPTSSQQSVNLSVNPESPTSSQAVDDTSSDQEDDLSMMSTSQDLDSREDTSLLGIDHGIIKSQSMPIVSDHAEGKKVQCIRCDLWLLKSSLKSHLRRHDKDFHFSCDVCSKKFFCNSKLKEHVAKIHKGKSVCKCNVCGKEMNTYRGMMNHIQQHSGVTYTCSTCGKNYTSPAALKRHEKTHDKSEKCDICDKVFTTKFELKGHSVLHSNNPQLFKCSDCDYQSKWKTAVERHVKTTHSTERPHVCDISVEKTGLKVDLNASR